MGQHQNCRKTQPHKVGDPADCEQQPAAPVRFILTIGHLINWGNKLDMAAKSRKKHKNKISGRVISMGCET